MNTKIFALITKNLQTAFNLPKYANISITQDTVVNTLPWTPARYSKFKDAVEAELCLPCDYRGTLKEIVADLSERYIHRFFAEIWKPRTGEYDHSGWALVEQVNKLMPERVLDVGCGYNPFKGRINNLIGIDPYNDAADYEVDILDYRVKPESHDVIIALGSINFNSKEGLPHKTGPWVDIFPWTFEIVNEFAEKYNLTLDEFKKEPAELGRLYFVYTKN